VAGFNLVRKICYVSGTRADYGLMQHTLRLLNQESEINLSICVTGMHLEPDFGYTVDEIHTDGFRVCDQIAVNLKGESTHQVSQAIGFEIIGFSKAFYQEQPDIVLLLGDRGEMLAAAIVAVHLNIPIVHIHGGERSGTIDESLRHAITKLSHYHFVATENARNRLVKMGEEPKNIFVVGAPGLDSIFHQNLEAKDSILPRYDLTGKEPYLLAIFHPIVQQLSSAIDQVQEILKALVDCNIKTLFLLPNADAGGQEIRNTILQQKSKRLKPYVHFPRAEYLALLSYASALVGNSSSGIIEAASLGTPVVNIGDRQNCRERNKNTIDVSVDQKEILEAIKLACSWKGRRWDNVYGDGGASKKIANLLSSIPLNNRLLEKLNTY
jgi:GDP/UDP-N,N'-diacetylbacillosamine 2-epimerase (hydrolysing)